MGVRVLGQARSEVHKRLDQIGSSRLGVDDTTIPNVVRRERHDVEAGDDAKVVAASLQSPVEIRVGVFVSIDNGAVSKHDLEVDHLVWIRCQQYNPLSYPRI